MDGSFWAINMLSLETFHILIKQLARSRKNLLASVKNNYSIFSLDQLDWQFKSEYANVPDMSSLSLFVPGSHEVSSEVTFPPRSKKVPIVLPEQIYRQILQLDGLNNYSSKPIVTSYIEYVDRTQRVSREVLPLDEWVKTSNCKLTEARKLMAASSSATSKVFFLLAHV
jgi:hypothetical protein